MKRFRFKQDKTLGEQLIKEARLATSRRKIKRRWSGLRIGLSAENCKVGRTALDLFGHV
jgi:hypothetical protein